MNAETVTVELSDRSYPIRIGSGILNDPEFLAAQVKGRRCFLVTDSNVYPLFAERTVEAVLNAGAAEIGSYTFPAGEESKHLGTILEICREAARTELDRKSLILALGGGVTGDMAGFSAAVYMRGIDFLQIPTTLLAMVDSSVGGKTGVDLPEGKNLVGAFHQPKAVLIDTDFLKTLPRRQYLCGVAEIVKTAAILDADFFALLEANTEQINRMDPEFTAKMVTRCCELKASVVAKDEREGSLRAILNYGHTYGHAIESASRFTMLHGEAVAIGMRMASELAVRLGVMRREDADRQEALIQALGLPGKTKYDPETVFGAMFKDKKVLGGSLRFIFTPEIGKAEIRKVESAEARAVLEEPGWDA